DKIDNETAAQEVMDLIDDIGTVTADSGDEIADARSAYDDLTSGQKDLVTNYSKLTDAEQDYLQVCDQASADEVRNMIASIGVVTINSGDEIDDAFDAYNALTIDQKELVTNYSTLLEAKSTYDGIKSTLVVPNYNIFDWTYYWVTAQSGLVLRYGPSTDYNKIVTMPYDSTVEVYAWDGNWAYVWYDGQWGWCNGDYLW
ncbi:MAG: SH3 domain-containing protein, partial [Firmicutes bacterium]|nr:SH3 domain-containing protein [Bacillota bacterium]